MTFILVEDKVEMLGTHFHVSLVCLESEEKIAKRTVHNAIREGERIEAIYSRFLDNNVLAELNGNVGQWVEVDSELYKLIWEGAKIHTQTNGAFDLTVKSVLEGWGYDKDYSLKEHEKGRLGEIEFNPEHQMVKISAEIDLGGIGKGYAIDQMAAILYEASGNFCVDGGGDIFCFGHDEQKRPWRILFGHPTDIEQAIGFFDVEITDKGGGRAFASSNPNLRKWRDRHHLVDPKTGEPASDMLAVYTQCNFALLADGYSTALFAMGYENAKELIKQNKIPVEAMLISSTGSVFRSQGFQGELFTK